ncbi:MAG TPA: DUF2283 domain-containing protein [Bdellovibrionota bacterium]|nr:DUF2283 domain-containing protein [Bdellovibrionota bacterium]
MKTIKDKKLDVAYVKFRSGRVVKTVEVKDGVLIDFDKNGKVLGIEVLALKRLAPLLRIEKKTKNGKLKKAA